MLCVAGLLTSLGAAALLRVRGRAGLTPVAVALAVALLGSAQTWATVYLAPGPEHAGVEYEMAQEIARAAEDPEVLPVLVPMENHAVSAWMGERLLHAPNRDMALALAASRGARRVAVVHMTDRGPFPAAPYTRIERVEHVVLAP